MALESWQILYILIALAGLLMGWLFDPSSGILFIWALVVAIEAFDYMKSRRVAKSSA